jgi:hypothetical protein
MRIAARKVLPGNSMDLSLGAIVASDQAGERNLIMLGVLKLAKAKRQSDGRLRLPFRSKRKQRA